MILPVSIPFKIERILRASALKQILLPPPPLEAVYFLEPLQVMKYPWELLIQKLPAVSPEKEWRYFNEFNDPDFGSCRRFHPSQ